MKDKQKTLVILTPAFPGNGVDTFWVTPKQVFVKALNRNYPELKLVILSFHYPLLASPDYTWNGNNVTTFNGDIKGKLNRIWLWLRVWKKLQKLKNTENIIGILSFWCAECALVGGYFSRIYRLKHHIWISGQDAKKDNKMVKLIRPGAGQLVAMSDFLVREFYKNHGIKPAHVIPIGVDVNMFATQTMERDIDIMGAGSLSPLKQFDVFIHVVKQLAIRFPGVKAIICGYGTERDVLLKMIEEQGLQKNITLMGAVPHIEVLTLMQRSRIFLHTSNYEGFGSVMIEALYAGAHVISFVKPMDENISHWHIAASQNEMVTIAADILQNPLTHHSPIQPYLMDNAAKSMMALFGINH